MQPYRISVIFGTRPEAIKLAPLILALKADRRFACRVCVTAQHRQLLDQVLSVFGIRPDIDFDLMKPSQSLGHLTARAIEALDGYLSQDKPELVLVQGDTTTVFCATLSAFYQRVPVAHVEAGLRTGNFNSPFPEEANRVLTTRLTALHFAPTDAGRRNLVREGVANDSIFVTGNTVIDALFFALEKIKAAEPDIPGLPQSTLTAWRNSPLVLITGHRRENLGAGLEAICAAVADLAKEFPGTQFVYPLHLNPSVRETVQRILGPEKKNVHLIEPLQYLPFVSMMNRATVILTDSGGVQEEAPSLGKPVLVMRDTTERGEAVEAGIVKLVGANRAAIVAEARRLLTDPAAYRQMAQASNPYGDGHATQRIIAACADFLERRRTIRAGH
jgi:UDP-N-acetylglucosamine 2-epimerase (non-hydrolysing)